MFFFFSVATKRRKNVLDGARRLVRGAAPKVCSRVRAAARAAGRAAGPDAPARQGAQGPRRLVVASGRRLPPRPRSCADSPRLSTSGGTRCCLRGGPRRSRAAGIPRSSTPGCGCWTAGAQDTLAGRAVPRGRRSGRRGGWRPTPGPGWGASRRLVGGSASWARRWTHDLPLWIFRVRSGG